MGSFIASRPGKAFRCGHDFKIGEAVYFEKGVQGYVCSTCAELYPAFKHNAAASTNTPETTLNQGIPLERSRQLAASSSKSREEAIAAMHLEKMLLLAELAEQLKQLVAAEQYRNAMLAAKQLAEGDSKGGKQ